MKALPRDWKPQVRRGVEAGLLVVAALWIDRCAFRSPPVVQEIAGAVRYVDRAVIESREPDAKIGRIERVTRPTVTADYTAIATGAGDSTVNTFCALSRDTTPAFDSLQVLSNVNERGHESPDTGPRAPILVRSIRTDSRWFPWQRSSLYAVSVSGSGNLIENRYQVRQGYSLRADSDSLVVQNPRLTVRPIVGSLILFGAGALVGAALQ